jgi:predicted RNA-binding protein
VAPYTNFQLAEWLSLVPYLVNYAVDFLYVATCSLSVCKDGLFTHVKVNMSDLVDSEQIFHGLRIRSIRLVSLTADIQNNLE